MDTNLHSNRAVLVMEDLQSHFMQIDTLKTGHDTKYHSKAPKSTLEWNNLSVKTAVPALRRSAHQLERLPGLLCAIQYISPLKYGFGALMKVYWGQMGTTPCNEAIESYTARTSADVLKNYSMADRAASSDAMILLAINVAFRAIGFLGLWLSLRESK